jgi:hypothetical protein
LELELFGRGRLMLLRHAGVSGGEVQGDVLTGSDS